MEDDLIQEFVQEAREHLATIETDLLAIEDAGASADAELLNKVFRAAHSIKGAAGFFDLHKVKELAHRAETVLDMLRSKQMRPNVEITNVLLRAFDRLRELVNAASGSNAADISGESAALQALASSYTPEPRKHVLGESVTVGTDQNISLIEQVEVERVRRNHHHLYQVELDLLHDIERQGRQIAALFKDILDRAEILDCRVNFEKVGDLESAISNEVPVLLMVASALTPEELATELGVGHDRVQRVPLPEGTSNESLEHVPEAGDAEIPVERESQSRSQGSTQGSAAVSAAEETLRVSVSLLDTLMGLAGELVLSRNQLQEAIARKDARLLNSSGQRVGQVTSEMQDVILRTRLQPIDSVFSRMPRLARDLAFTLGKEVRLDLLGREVALDRSLVEGLSDPLTHMLRNALDHGIELPEVRVRAGKPRTGAVRLEARHDAGQVVIELEDDGRGIDHERVANAAVKKGLISEEQLRGMTPDEQASLIMLPGLSTAEKVTDVSGRGVGMDVVKTNLERLGGQIEIRTRKGQGTKFTVKLPLTLSIIPALILSVNEERFAIPQVNVEELLRIRGEDRLRRIEVIGDTEVLVLRDSIVPLLRFSEFLGVEPTYVDEQGERCRDRRVAVADRRSKRSSWESDEESKGAEVRAPGRRVAAASALEVAVVSTGNLRYGLIVDAFHNTEEIVVKPLGRDLKQSHEYAGATILGDGTIALILDAGGLARRAGLTSVSASPRGREQRDAADGTKRDGALHSLLCFRNAPHEHAALPLELVRRIERIRPAQVEVVGSRRTMKYRETSLPLVCLADAAAVEAMGELRELVVIVSSIYGREVGLLGAMPVEVVESRARIDGSTHRQSGISGSAILEGETTMLVDLVEIVDKVYPEWRAAEPRSQVVAGATILLAEDSDFFRSQVKRFLEADGHQVIAAADGEEAWKLLQDNLGNVRVVVTDIEMPRVSGLDLTAKIRADQRTKDLPVIAVSSLAGDDDVAKAMAVGVTEYQVKLDRDSLLMRVRQLLSGTSMKAELEVTA